MGIAKKIIRKGDKPWQQLARRYAELEDIKKNCSVFEDFILEQPHKRGPLTHDCVSNPPDQYKILKSLRIFNKL